MEDLDPGLAARVAVVGAGYAGMAAAATLAARGARVTVFEATAVPGGRARRVQARGGTLDNGQHILIGAYGELFRLMRAVGVPAEALLRLPLELRYAAGFRLRALWLPAPLGLAGGLLAARGLSWRERIGALRFLHALGKSGYRTAPEATVAELLERHGQGGALARYLWEPLCVSALNTPPAQASANVFLAVLRDTLAGAADAADLLLPRVDLTRLFPEPAAEFVRARGGEVRLSSPVRSLSELAGFSAVIVAVAPQHAAALVPGLALDYTYQPIYTCYLQYEKARLPYPMLGLSGGLVQWVFDRGALLGEKGRVACVMSAQGAHQDMAHEALALACHGELASHFRLGAPLWSRVIAEKRATVTCAPGRARPPEEIDGVFLAGDYTDPEYPPTLEAAVRSGVRAAERVLARRVSPSAWQERASASSAPAG